MNYLPQLTFVINYAAFILVFWLGMYLVLHNPRYSLSWLTAFTLWSLATSFLHYLLSPAFSSNISFENPSYHWLQGLAVAPALAFWHHATMLMRPRQLNPWRRIRILAAYLIAAAAVVVQATVQIWSHEPGGDLLYLNSRKAGPLYPVFGAALLLFIIASMINIFRSAKATPATLPRKQLLTLAWATLIAGFTGPTLIIATILGLPIPTTVISFLLAITIGLIGYGVARYSALMEGRTIHRDFFYNLVMVALVSAIYIPVGSALLKAYQVPLFVFILIPVLAVFTHSLVNPAYRLVDWFFLHRETRQLRSDLQRLSRLAFEGDTLTSNLKQALHDICYPIRASYGILLTFEESLVRTITDYQWSGRLISLSAEILMSDDVTHLSPGQLPAPLEEASLLVPLYRENEQFGALLLGQPVNGTRYANDDVERILNPVEMIGEALHISWIRKEWMAQVAKLAGTQLPEDKSRMPVELVENVFRNLYDFAFLADSSLANLGLVQIRLPHGSVTHLDRGKAVYEVMLEALNKLKPERVIVRDPPSREWYPYLILKEAYLDEVSNRDIMMHLYISEGTFNRTRRAAIRSVARTLEEMENNLR